MHRLFKTSSIIAAVAAILLASSAAAQSASGPGPAPSPQPASLDALFELVERGFDRERELNRAKEERFLREKARQEELVAEAQAAIERARARSDALEADFAQNEALITDLTARREKRVGDLGELFGVVRQVAGDLQSHLLESVTSSQLGSREDVIGELGRGTGLPKTSDLEHLWIELYREMVQQGKVVSYKAPVLSLDGNIEEKLVTRAGVFTAVADGRYLIWDSAIQKLRELPRQPPSRYVNTVGAYISATTPFESLAIDPSRGALLSALIRTPSQAERIQQGGAVGYTIIILGIFAVLVGLWRWVVLSIASRRVTAQRNRTEVRLDNPLGRVLAVFDANRGADPEALELKLDEAGVRETEKLDRFLWVVKVVSVVAPLLGLLGTVTGMIQTFQVITLFGAGDPRMMAGGISEALVTTMLGLVVASPLVLIHALLLSSKRRILKVLTEHSAGLVALQIENADART